jgi:hypothetical protein
MKSLNFKINWLKKGSKSAFSYLAGINRPVNPSQVTKLAESINKMGLIRPVVVTELSFITGKKVKYIVDGQHLFNACLRNNIDIPYVSIDVADKKELVERIALLNASSKNWTMADYVLAWSSLNNDYVKLNQYFNMYDFEISALADILSGGLASTSGNISTKIKKGEFKIVNEAYNIEIVNNLTDLLKIVPRMNRYENRYLCTEYVKFRRSEKTYNHSIFLKKVQKNKTKFLLATQESGKLVEMFKSLI